MHVVILKQMRIGSAVSQGDILSQCNVACKLKKKKVYLGSTKSCTGESSYLHLLDNDLPLLMISFKDS